MNALVPRVRNDVAVPLLTDHVELTGAGVGWEVGGRGGGRTQDEPSGRPSSCGRRLRRGFWRQTLSTSQEPWFKSFGNKQLVKNLKGKSRTFGQRCVPARGDPHISSTRLHPSLSPQDPETSTSPMVSRVHAFP